MGSSTLQTLQELILLLPWLCFRGGGFPPPHPFGELGSPVAERWSVRRDGSVYKACRANREGPSPLNATWNELHSR
jgi:hypothetical protein